MKYIKQLIPARREIAFGKFVRSQHDLYMLVNSSEEPYQGQLTLPKRGEWQVFDPQTGSVSTCSADAQGRLSITLGGNQTLLYVSR